MTVATRPETAPDATEKIQAAKSSGIRFVQLQFTDIIGHVKAVTIPIHQLEGSVKHGTWFDGSSIEGFTRIAESDQYLMPDMDTFAEIPWQPGSGPRGTARVICDVFTPNGEPFVGDPRGVLRRPHHAEPSCSLLLLHVVPTMARHRLGARPVTPAPHRKETLLMSVIDRSPTRSGGFVPKLPTRVLPPPEIRDLPEPPRFFDFTLPDSR